MIPSAQPTSEAPPPGPPEPPPHLKVGRVGRRKPRTFHPLAFLVVGVTGLVTLGLGAGVFEILYDRLEWSSDGLLATALVVGVLVQLAGGFLAARVGRKLCLLEHFLVALGLLGLGAASATVLHADPTLLPGVLAGDALGHLVGAAAGAAFGVLFFGFLGSTFGFLLGGSGPLDLGFSYERYIARRHLLAKKRTTFISVITVISVCAVAVGVWALVVVLSVMSGFEADLQAKILGTNAHAVVLKYATPFDEWQNVEKDVRQVKGITGVSPFVIGTVMVSTGTQTEGVVLKGINPATVGQVTDLPKNVVSGKLAFLAHPARILPWATAHESDLGFEGDQAPPAGPETGTPPGPGGARTPPAEGAKGGAGSPPPAGDAAAGDAAPPPAHVLPGIAIGQELARSLRAMVGDKLTVISPVSQDLGPTGPVPRSKTFRVAAIFYTGMYEYDSKFGYIDLPQAQRFFDMGKAVTGLELRTTDIDDTRAITHRVLTHLEGYPFYTKDWGEMNKNLFSALKLEKLVMAVILAFIVLVASFVILATLIMMVMEKGKEIAILKSMGVRDASIMKVFVLEGLTVGLIGTAVGVVLGLATCALVASGIISLDPQVYYISTLPVRVEPMQIVLTCIIAVILSYLATIYPSVTASRLHPVEGLRDE